MNKSRKKFLEMMVIFERYMKYLSTQTEDILWDEYAKIKAYTS